MIDSEFDSESVAEMEYATVAPDACDGYSCTITGAAYQGLEIRVSCGNEYTVMAFCYKANCETVPGVGDTICLQDAPDGSNRIDTQCLNDPCCIPCDDEPQDDVAVE